MEVGDWRSGDAAFVDKANAWVEQKGYTDVGFTTEEIVDFLENPGADVELSDLELEIVAGGATMRAEGNADCFKLACWP